jgi:hypothetical protein
MDKYSAYFNVNSWDFLSFIRPINIAEITEAILEKKKLPAPKFASCFFNLSMLDDEFAEVEKMAATIEKDRHLNAALKIIYINQTNVYRDKLNLIKSFLKEDDNGFFAHATRLYSKPSWLLEHLEIFYIKLWEDALKKAKGSQPKSKQTPYKSTTLTGKDFHKFLEFAIKPYQKEYGFEVELIPQEENIVPHVSVKQEKINFNFPLNKEYHPSEVLLLFVHEIETHAFKRFNAMRAKNGLLIGGTRNSLRLDEGIATYRETKFAKDYLGIDEFQSVNFSVLCMTLAEKKNSFVESVNTLTKLGFNTEFLVPILLTRIFPGIHNLEHSNGHYFTKDYLYDIGLIEVNQFMDEGGDLKDLYIGLCGMDDYNLFKAAGEKSPAILPFEDKKFYQKLFNHLGYEPDQYYQHKTGLNTDTHQAPIHHHEKTAKA